MSIISLDHDLIHYEVLGHGRPLIFLHGWVGSWRYWIQTMQAVSISYRTYAIDFWGFGDSPNRPDKYFLEQQVELLNEFINEMGIGRVALVGHGLGALVGLSYAREYPDVVDRLAITGFPLERSMINSRLGTDSIEQLTDWLLGKSPVASIVRMETLKTDYRAILGSLDTMKMVDWKRLIGEINTPCLLIHGALDPLISSFPEEINPHFPDNAHQIIFEESGHFPMLDEARKYNRLLADFLSLQQGESPRKLQLKDEWKRRIR